MRRGLYGPTRRLLMAWWPWPFVFVLKLLRVDHPGGFYLSNFTRDPDHNAAVGGDRDSQHLISTAADLVPRDGNIAGLAAAVTAAGLIAVPKVDHVHAQLFRAGQRPDGFPRAVSL